MRISLLVMVGLMFSVVIVEAADFEYDGWPGEGVPGFSVKNSSLQLNKTPNMKSAVISVPVQTGENILNADFVEYSSAKSRLTYDKSKVITRKSVTWVARTAVTNTLCSGLPVPVVGQQPVIQAGEKVEMLQYRAEGYVLARYKGVVCEVYAADSPDKFDGMDQVPEVEWWIRVISPDKEVLGWLLINGSQLNYLPRNF